MSVPVLLRSEHQKQGLGSVRTAMQERYIPKADPTEHDPYKNVDLFWAKAFTRVLMAHYPGHFWEVTVSHEQGIATIAIPILMGTNEKYILKLAKGIQPDDIMRAGGDLLERWNIPRSGLDLPAFLAAKARADRMTTKERTPR